MPRELPGGGEAEGEADAALLGDLSQVLLGELLNDRGDVPKAFLVGFGSFLAFVVGTGVKLAASAGMLIHVAADTYPALRDWFATTF
jgi:uncharacterized protein YqgC (DUF456 family)